MSGRRTRHGGGEEHHDPSSKRAGLQAAILAVLVAIVGIMSHRSHTEVILLKNDENDAWGHYQAKRIRASSKEDLAALLDVVVVKEPLPQSG